jgi:hypothetical protein
MQPGPYEASNCLEDGDCVVWGCARRGRQSSFGGVVEAEGDRKSASGGSNWMGTRPRPAGMHTIAGSPGGGAAAAEKLEYRMVSFEADTRGEVDVGN